jgi:MFS family permease
MGKQQATALCVCTVVIYCGISGLVGLMPVYLTRLGADATVTGLFLASAYLALALSNVVAGRVSDRFQRRKLLLILGGVLAAPLAWLMSRATTVGPLWALMASLWFVIGVPMTMANILTGLSSASEERGRSFGLLGLSSGIGLFFGGLVSGPIVDRRGFPALFATVAGLYLLVPLAGRFVQDQAITARKVAAPIGRHIVGNRTFTLLFVASILAQAANIVIFLSRPLIMDARHFDATTISRAGAVGSLVTLPLPLVIGWLADRIGRKAVIAACFLAPPLGLLVQAAAVRPWHFWVSSVLATVLGFSTVAGAALLADTFPDASLGTALALLNATPWIGIVIGLSAGGLAIRVLQMTAALLLAALLSLVALLLLLPVAEAAPARLVDVR